jgi:tetratricopeptide (TPR) repeat protein
MGCKLIMYKLTLMALLLLGCAMPAATQLTMADRAARIINRTTLSKSDVLSARDTVMIAMESEIEKSDPYSWLVKGFIYKEMFKIVDDSSVTSTSREIAVESIEKCIELDKKKLYTKECNKVLDFLANSYFNHSAYVTLSGSPDSFEESEKFYNKTRKLLRLMNPSIDLTEWDINYHLNKAKALTKVYERDVYKNDFIIDQAIESFKLVLAMDTNNHEANFNIGTAFYNRGVYKVRKITFDVEIDSLILIQDQCIQLFLKALPYMEKAYELRPRHKDTLKGMWFIERALSEDEKAGFYRGEIERLILNGTIEESNAQK